MSESGSELLERLAGEPGARELLELAPPGAYLVGGAVRDLLLGRAPRELDVVLAGVGGAAPPTEGELAARLARELRARSSSSEHERFGTATVEWEGGRIDIAAARRERYARPGALPEVELAPLAEDLLRRDFTVNAIAVALAGERRGSLEAAPGALEDLCGGVLRVLHDGSFVDDPTRLWRLARYRARLGFAVEAHTAELAAGALAAGAPGAVSGARIGAELRLALDEPDPLAALVEIDRLGLLVALHPRLRLEPDTVRRGLQLLAADAGHATPGPGRADVLTLAAMVLSLTLRAERGPADGGRGVEAATLLDRLELGAAVRDDAVASALAAPALMETLARPLRPSQLRAAVLGVPPEGVALAGALGEGAGDAVRGWLGELRHVRPRIDGHDLLEHGIPEGPDVGRRLEAVLGMLLDGELPDEREAQLRAALAV